MYYVFWLFLAMLLCVFLYWVTGRRHPDKRIKTIDDVVHLFPQTADEVREQAQKAIKKAQNEVAALIAIPDNKRTFENTPAALDKIIGDLGQEISIFSALMSVSPVEAVRNGANEEVIVLQDYAVDAISQNKELYKVFKRYAEERAPLENLSPEERYYIEETLKSFKRNGLDLPEKEQENIKRLKKELGTLGQAFTKAISDDLKKVTVTKAELEGLAPDFIDNLKKNDEGLYELGTDYPTYLNVMENCTVEPTRKALWIAFNNRAYPVNEKTLSTIIDLRDDLAHALGFASFAHYDIDDEMANRPETVDVFLDDIISHSQRKAFKEVERYKANLPAGITLSPDGTIKPWDWIFIKESYKKNTFNLDSRVVAEYFPVESTVAGLLKLYEKFLSIRFKQLPDVSPYGVPVKAVQVNTIDGHLIGYLLLDLYPRPNKYTHACQITLVHATKTKSGRLNPTASMVIANFPKPTPDKPALLTHQDVITFFHEFGHAIHALLGATELASFSGTNVKNDFVEMPSQMLEEWMWDKDIIKGIGKHYKTGQPIPDELLDVMIKLKNLDSGDLVTRQAMFAKLSLDYFKNGKEKDTTAIAHGLQRKLRPYLMVVPEDHFKTAFGHLVNYGSKYYGYLWSKVYALDLFEFIKTKGLLNPEIGSRYVATILSKGGSRPPQELLREFLGREPNSEAFFRDSGF